MYKIASSYNTPAMTPMTPMPPTPLTPPQIPSATPNTQTKTKCNELLHDLDSCFHNESFCDDLLQKYLIVCLSQSHKK